MNTLCHGFRRLSLGMAAFVFVGLIGISGEVSAASTEHSSKKGFCINANLPVALGANRPFDQKVHTTYCQPFKWAKGGHQIDMLTEGATYNASYWDWPVSPNLYSYVDKTLAQGRATLAYDRIGAGQSSHPVSSSITEETDAYVLHELLQLVRVFGYSHVNSIGHSYGSGIALEEAATYNDISRLVLTGYLHRASNPAVTAGNYPANQDPAFAAQSLDGGYLTTRPGARATSFYSSSADPSVIAYDEAHKDLVSLTGLLDFLGKRGVVASSNLSNNIHVPLLVLVGQQDAIFCFDPTSFNCTDNAAVTANETPYYTGAPSLQVSTVANTGHDLALHPSANQSFQTIDQWIKNH